MDNRGKRPDGARKNRQRARLAVQLAFAALTNGYVKGFVSGRIYTGPLKQLCVPGLNCYSCPGALGACPIGALQATLSSRGYKSALYVLGFLAAVGALAGRAVCGFLCPFGLVQDLLYKLPLPKGWKKRRLPGEKALRALRWAALGLLCVLLPLAVLDGVGQGSPWFCKWVCPSGTLLGSVPLLAANEALRGAVGFLWAWKMALLAGLCALSAALYRPFCRYLCPLGAVYGVFNRFALYRYTLRPDACTGCGACAAACPLALNPARQPNSMQCVRCGRCLSACPTGALGTTAPDIRSMCVKKQPDGR